MRNWRRNKILDGLCGQDVIIVFKRNIPSSLTGKLRFNEYFNSYELCNPDFGSCLFRKSWVDIAFPHRGSK